MPRDKGYCLTCRKPLSKGTICSDCSAIRLKQVDKLPEGAKELKVKGYNTGYTDNCTNCGKEFSYLGDKRNPADFSPCSADCEQALFDKGDDPTLWSQRKRLEVGYNKGRLMIAREFIRRINEAALQLEDLFSDYDPHISNQLKDVELVNSVQQLTKDSQDWLDAIDATFTEEVDSEKV